MKVTGIQLIQAIHRWALRKETAANQFDESLTAFDDEVKLTPDQIATAFVTAETNVARLQTALALYNTMVIVDVDGIKMTLAEAVKRLGGAGRIHKKWRDACGGKKDRYSISRDETRRTDEIRAKRTISVEDAMIRANRAAQFAGALRAAIAVGNVSEFDTDQIKLDPRLLTE